MDKKNIKIVWKKYFKPIDGGNSEQHYYKALHDFMYENNGCLTGYKKEIMDDDKTQLSYQCIGPYKESDIKYIKDNIIQHHQDVNVTNKLDISGEVYITVGEE